MNAALKLSEAILLGDTLKTADPSRWLSLDGSCGCALGGAVLAVGKYAEILALYKAGGAQDIEKTFIGGMWPWITPAFLLALSHRYYNVYYGSETIEQLCDWVRSIEPSPQIHAATENQTTQDLNEGGDPGDEHVEPLKVGR